VKPDINSKGL